MNTLSTHRGSRGQDSITYESAPLAELSRPLPTLDPQSSPGGDFISLAEYWHILLKRRWTVLAAVDEGVPAPVITTSLFERFQSRGLGEFTDQVLSAMRSEFGGHAEKK